MKKTTNKKLKYTVIIDPDDCPDFEDYDTYEEAKERANELAERGYSVGIGYTYY